MPDTQRLIENSDRGVTLNKSLAWTIASALVTVGLYVGLTLATMSTKIEQMTETYIAAERSRDNLESRVRSLEQVTATTTARFDALYSTLQEMKLENRELGTLLRRYLSLKGAEE